jgi:hypothetical protein
MNRVVVWPKFMLVGKTLEAVLRGDAEIPVEPVYVMTGRELGECLAQTEPFEVVEAVNVPFEEWYLSSS